MLQLRTGLRVRFLTAIFWMINCFKDYLSFSLLTKKRITVTSMILQRLEDVKLSE